MVQTVWETEWLLEYIQDKKLVLPHVFVDVGAGDGEHQSNSHEFIKQGWYALLIDGLEENILRCSDLYAERSHVDFVCALVLDKEEDVFFEQDKRHWALSAIRPGIPNSRTSLLSKILKQKNIGAIGILSLDIEGNEDAVLRDLIQNRIFPKILIVEGNTFEAMAAHREMLSPYYKFIGGVFPNQIFLAK